MTQPAKYSMKWYKQEEEKNLKLRSKLLKYTKMKKDETPREWLNRVNRLYQQQKRK